MEPEGDGVWRNEMREYIRSVGNFTAKALKRIKRDRIQNNLPFDGAFQKYFLQKTNARIADVYTDVLFDESLDGGQTLAQGSGTGNANILEMPVIMEQSNNQNASTPFEQNDSEMLEKIVISIPSNPLTSPQSLEQTQRIRTNIPVASKDCRSMERSIDTMPNKSNGNRNSVHGRSTSTSVGSLEFLDSFEQVDKRKPETIDLTTDEGELDGVMVGEHSDGIVLNMLQNRCPSKANKYDAHVENQMITSKSPTDSSRTQQKIERDVHTNGLLSPNVVTESNVLQHSEIVLSKNANNEITADDNDDLDLDPMPENSVATALKTNDNQHIGPIALSGVKTVFNSHEATKGIARARDVEGGNQRPQYPESIDSNSKDEEAVSQAANNVCDDVQNVVRPTIAGRKSKNGNASASGHLKKKSKLANKRTVDTKKRYKCDFCEYSTVRKQHLNYHIRTHTNERPYRCEVCDKRFTQQQHLNTHMKRHRDMFAFQCSNCRRGFSTEREWKLHGSRCKAIGYECHLCKKVFIQKSHLVQHMRAHTGEKLRCPKCRKQFSYKHGLAYHMTLHGKQFRFQCSICRLGFSKRTTWHLHESRCKSKQFECFLCGKKFYQQKCNLLVHMRHKHTGEKPFGCSECPLRFCEKVELTRHTKSRH